MGLDKIFADFLVAAHDAGTRFDRVITLGRLHNHLAQDVGVRDLSSPVVSDLYANSFFKCVLQARALDVLDYSDYQGANVIHDLNEPIKAHLVEQYDAAIDGGTLEHVFDYPTALRNLLSLSKIGGSLFLFTPANNLFGHGFYQFSPDLFYRIFSEQNGCRLQKMALAESFFVDVERGFKKRVYQVLDPQVKGMRSILVNAYPAMLLVQAIKTDRTPPKLRALQSDYVAIWNKKPAKKIMQPSAYSLSDFIKGLFSALVAVFPRPAQRYLRSRYEAIRFYSIKRHPCFAPAPPEYFASDWLIQRSAENQAIDQRRHPQ